MTNILRVTVDDKKSEIDVDKLTFAEGRAIEKVTGMGLADALKSQNLTTVQALVWVTIKRHNPGFKFSDLDDVAIGDVDFEMETDDAEGDGEDLPTEPTTD